MNNVNLNVYLLVMVHKIHVSVKQKISVQILMSKQNVLNILKSVNFKLLNMMGNKIMDVLVDAT